MSKKLVNYFLFTILITVFSGIGTVYAAENNKQKDGLVDPNVYEEKEISIYRYYDRSINETKELPEDIRELSFKSQNFSKQDLLLDELFTTTSKGKNTILTKATNLQLFPGEYSVDEKSEAVGEGKSFNRLNILLITIFVVTITLLFSLIPKLNRVEQ